MATGTVMGKPSDDPPELPGVLGELAEAVDLRSALALARWRGGVRIYVPQSLPDGHELILRVGPAAAQWLSDHYPSEYIEIPRAHDYVLRMRDAEIRRKHFQQGTSCHALALEYGLTARQVWTILAATDIADRQMELL